MAEIKDIVKLAVDGYKGKVEKYSVKCSTLYLYATNSKSILLSRRYSHGNMGYI